nr:uncharacterized mitochondrial protein AtMg00810-like [Tanacetum cinerariifolium]
ISDYPDKVYKVVKALYGLHQAPELDGKSASTSIDTKKPLLKDPDGEDVDVNTYRSMIGSLMYLTSSRPDIMFAVCACACFQVTPKASHLHAVKRIFRYLKGKPHLGLWYPKDSPFDLVAYSDSDYAGASLDRKSTTGGCQFLGVNIPRCDEDKLELMKLMVFLLSNDENVRVEVSDVDLQVSAVRLVLLLLVQKFLLFGLRNWCCSLSAVSMESLQRMVYVTNILSAGSLTSQQMVLNSPCLTHIKNWLVQIKRSLGVECVPNEEIFVELARMGYEKPSTKLTFYKAFFLSQWKFLIHTILQCMTAKRTLWNEFSSLKASAVICLSSGRKFNFSKYIFDILVRNVDSPTKFYMYPLFLQLMIRKQVGDLSTHTTKYTSPALKVFANIRRVGKGFSRVETSLFEGMEVAQEVGEGVANEVHDEGVPAAGIVAEGDVSAANDAVPTANEEPSIPSPTPPTPPPQPSQDIPSTSQERMIADIDAEADVVLEEAKDVADDAKDDQDADVLSMQEEESKPAELQKVVDIVTTAKIITKVVTTASTTITAADVSIPSATTAVAPALIDEVTDHVNKKAKEDPAVKRYQALKRKPQTDIRPVFERYFDSNVAFLQKTKEQIDEEESRALKRINETPAEKVTKRQKLDKEVEELKRHLQIVPNDKDDVYTEATLLLAREDLKVLWSLVKERFATTKPKNFFYDLLLITLGAIFEKLDIHAQIRKNQKSVHGQAKVKS